MRVAPNVITFRASTPHRRCSDLRLVSHLLFVLKETVLIDILSLFSLPLIFLLLTLRRSMVPSNIWPHTHHDVSRHLHEQYDRQIAAGEYRPLLYPWDTLGALVVLVYMLIPHQNRPWLRKARFLVFAYNLAYTTYLVRNVRARGVASALGIGLIAAWSTMYIGALVVCNDPQKDFMRIERQEGAFGSKKASATSPQNGTMIKNVEKSKEENGSTSRTVEAHERLGPSQRHGAFAWQPYPITPFVERLDWVLGQ